MFKKFLSAILVVSLLFSLVVPSSAASANNGEHTLLHTQAEMYDGKQYTFELYSDGTSLVYADDGENGYQLQLAPDGTAVATVRQDGQTENFILDIEDLRSEKVDFDIYSSDEGDIAPQSIDDSNLVAHISSFDELQAIATGEVQTRAAAVFTVAVLSLITLVYVTVTLPYASRYINGVKYDYLSLIIEAVRRLEESSVRYYMAYCASSDHDVLINFAAPINRNTAINRIRANRNKYSTTDK